MTSPPAAAATQWRSRASRTEAAFGDPRAGNGNRHVVAAGCGHEIGRAFPVEDCRNLHNAELVSSYCHKREGRLSMVKTSA